MFLNKLVILPLLLVGLLWWPPAALSAIAYVTSTDSTAPINGGQSSISTSVTVDPSTTLLVICTTERTAGAVARPSTSATFNTSENFTSARTDSNLAGGPSWSTRLWYLANPTVTTANVSVGYSAAPDQAQAYSVLQFSGADTASVVDAVEGGSGTGTAIADSITTVSADAWIIDCAFGQADTGLTAGSGQTARVTRVISTSNESVGISTVNGKASPGAETMDWTQATSLAWVISEMAIKPAAAGATSGSGVMLLGVGR